MSSERSARPLAPQAPSTLGVRLMEGGAEFSVFSHYADRIWLCRIDPASDRETERWLLSGRQGDIHHEFIPGLSAGDRYGLRADGPYDPKAGQWFDPDKFLVDPYATTLDRPFAYRAELAAPRASNVDTAPLMPRAIVAPAQVSPAQLPARPRMPRLIYELTVRGFSERNEAIAPRLRGTIAALVEPANLEHLARLGVSHVELMPVTAWMDERHLPPLGLTNAWGYNPVTFMALDPRLAPGGIAELRDAVSKFHAAGIGVLLDLVFNHTAESDVLGPTLSLRGLDNATYYRHAADNPGQLINDTGCGNTLACDRAPVVRLVMDSLRFFVEAAGIDGFRFDLATILGRTEHGFTPEAPLITAMVQDPVLRHVHLIAEPWDIGPGGYGLGAFPTPFLEWSDHYRDDIRRFWRGDQGAMGALATRLAGSADIFRGSNRPPSASVNFVAAHDGFALRDVVSFASKHNEANGENNRDGTDANYSWNNGTEGPGGDAQIEEARNRDLRALLATLIVSRGTPMLTAGDEFGRSQRGNNNAYAQDNDITWLDWANRNENLADFFARLMRLRNALPAIDDDSFLDGRPVGTSEFVDVAWHGPSGQPLHDDDWRNGDILCALFANTTPDGIARACIVFNRSPHDASFTLPQRREGHAWVCIADSGRAYVDETGDRLAANALVSRRSVTILREDPIAG